MIVIPMAGLSRRFTVAGYTVPKYMLLLHNKSVFAYAVNSFSSLFESTPFLFIAREIAGTENFIHYECAQLGILDYRIAIINSETAGQAETVEYGLNIANVSDHEPLTIFNIDTFRSDFQLPVANWFLQSDGYLEVFKGEGINWSYVAPAQDSNEPIVVRTAEKEAISDLCCNGLYHFARAVDLRYSIMKERSEPQASELYIAPLYNHLINMGRKIHYEIIPSDIVTFCGIPEEYEALKQRK